MNIQRTFRNVFFATALVVSGRQVASAQECAIGITLSPAKATYSQDDLLEVNVAISNRGNSDESIFVAYPALQHPAGVNLSFTPFEGLTLSAQTTSGGLSAPILLPARRTLTTKIYLERFLVGFRPRRYSILWAATLRCEGKNVRTSSQGLLTFDIVATSNPGLPAVFAALLDRAQTADAEGQRYFQGGSSDLFTERPYRVDEAIEALRMANSPLVIPFLGQLAAKGDAFVKGTHRWDKRPGKKIAGQCRVTFNYVSVQAGSFS